MNKVLDIGFEEALKRSMENVFAVKQETLPVDLSVGRMVAKPVYAMVDSPSVDASLKDGYAVVSSDLVHAALDNLVKLRVSGHVAAGDSCGTTVAPGYAVRILSGAPIPEGADAVVAEEFVALQDQHILAFADAGPGRNILEKGADVFSGERLMDIGDRMRPQTVALVVAGGISEIPVFSRPTIGLLATGSEVLLPGSRLEEGKLYASNLAMQHAWLTSEGFDAVIRLSGDSEKDIADAVTALLSRADVLITSGGAWKGDHDLMVKVLDKLGWKMIFHRVRIGPGKAVGMGMLWDKPVFCLPGGPASNETSFMMIVFPAILKMAGYRHTPYLQLYGCLARSVSGQADWTQFIQCGLSVERSQIILHPKKMKSRLAAMAKSAAVIKIPEGVDTLLQGSEVPFICLDPHRFMMSIPR